MEVRVIGWLRYCLVVPTDALIDDDLIINVLVMTYFYSWILEVQKVCDSFVHGTVYTIVIIMIVQRQLECDKIAILAMHLEGLCLFMPT